MKTNKHKQSGQNLYSKAKQIIPGGTQLLSKRPEMFLPNLWPSYYSKAKGYNVWDLDGNKFIDFATMGIGACSLGYADSFVNKKVKEAISNGSMSTLNCHEEVELAERLINLHPWSDMARFSRGGGEACSIAARIARASSGKDKILFCGYHGWHDWYISANIESKSNLNAQLLSGLDSAGIPSNLEGTSIPFLYNNIDMVKSLVKKYRGQIAAIFMEPVRANEPKDDFLQEIRQICDKEKIILIFDEVTSGFRKNPGGVHLNYKVNPDIAVFGKALGNGFPISAVIGRSKIMKYAQDTFISSTFWTERVGFVAANKTLELMERTKSYEKVIANGKYINQKWKDLANKYQIDIDISGIESITSFSFKKNNLLYKTYITQEMLKKGFLASNLIYLSTKHTKAIIDKYIISLDKVFKKIKEHMISKKKIKLLQGPISHTTFKRLND